MPDRVNFTHQLVHGDLSLRELLLQQILLEGLSVCVALRRRSAVREQEWGPAVDLNRENSFTSFDPGWRQSGYRERNPVLSF